MRVLIASLLLSTSATAVMADDNFYAGFELGATRADRGSLENDLTGLSLSDKKNLGTMGGLYAGRTFGKWRLEGEYAIRKNRYHSMEVAGTGGLDLDQGHNLAGGVQKSDAIMANAWYEFAEFSGWKALVGAGLGFADVEVKRERSGQALVLDDSRWQFANQVMAQIVKPIDGGLEFGMGFRHFRTHSRDFVTEARTSSYKVVNNEVFVRLSWRFGASSEPMQAEPVRQAPEPVVRAEPTPAPAPVVTPQVVEEKKPEPKPVALPGPFMVFFDFDKSDITPDAAKIIKAAAKAFKEHKAVRIMATGHADRAGSEEYNMRLSERRAAAVKAALIAEGIDAGNIMMAAKGESSPLVATDDGVREPQNRRSEILLKR
ncbi:OmpA family protein [Kordiimonas lacus]|uniref:Outer membrane protein OmpA n=1 Tax=Kordiimonas lacus TaxID=637679 RepID=A0A1G6VMT7_9PROT|nr:OmpA family protein [Kordiimonas lacus]SDD54899.1 Outer membrane protein OmpA [Kordiimonas lacus]